MLEKDIEAKVVKWAKAKGLLVRKMNGMGFAGWPDRLFVGDNGRCLWIEFKRPGGKLSVGQQAIIASLHERGHIVFVVDDVAVGIDIISAFTIGDVPC